MALGALFPVRPLRSRTPSRSRKQRRQLLRDLHPRHPYLRRLRVGSNRWWRASQRLQRYPPQARGVQGVVSLAFTIDRHGKVVSSRIVKSSGSAVLDAEALDLIKRAAPLPPPPADIADSELSFVVPIRFAAR